MAAKSKGNEVLWAQRDTSKPARYGSAFVFFAFRPASRSPTLFFTCDASKDAANELLIDAVRSGQEVRVRDALQKGADIDAVVQCPTHPPIWNIGAMSALMLAAHRGDLALVQLLLDKKASKSVANHLGRRARDYAKDEKMRSLLE